MSAPSRNPLGFWAVFGLVIMSLCVLGGGAYFFRSDPTAIAILAGGVIAAALLLLLYAAFGVWRRRRLGKPLERAVLVNAAAQPNQISAATRRANMDDLRKSFEGGIAKLRAAGKDLYSLPWYVLVGEPGGGKSEAIRRSAVGFPPGLQDSTQGAGGTLNMNWWFTNHAIILDTAGRMMFEEVAPGTTAEWDHFLKLLTKARPNCPVNGMILVVPADSLIRDTAQTLDAKAGKIAEQLNRIQRTLGVRFPVFVLVTKCDLVTGFREFFEELTDPQLRHQMLGWSNPAPLDEPFKPEQVDRHLRSVTERLCRRRQALLLNPPETSDTGQDVPRLDRLDSLYAFPDAFAKIIPQLRRYLEVVFAAGEWSPKPLFLRGLYFTSSVREGEALDAQLAAALGVPVGSLASEHAEKSRDRERAYFLRDLLIVKIFRERGLVTRSRSARGVQQRRRFMGLAACFLCAAALLIATWTGARRLEQSVGQQSRYWMSVSAHWADHPTDWAIIQPITPGRAYRYNGGSSVGSGDSRTTLGQFFADASQRAAGQIEVPWVFRAQSLIGGDINDRRKQAYRKLYETSVLRPVIEASRQKLALIDPDHGDLWPPEATDAMVELIRLELHTAGLTPPARPDQPLLNLDALMRFLLAPEEYAAYRIDHRQALQDAMTWLFDHPRTPTLTTIDDSAWPPASLTAHTDSAMQPLQSAARALGKYESRALAGKSPRLANVLSIVQSLDAFGKSEDALLRAIDAAGPAGPPSLEQFAPMAKSFSDRLREIADAARAADAAIAAQDRTMTTGQSLLALYEILVEREIESALRSYEKLYQPIPDPRSATAATSIPAPLANLRKMLADAGSAAPDLRTVALSEETQNALARADRQYLRLTTGLDSSQHREYQVRARLWDETHSYLETSLIPPPTGASPEQRRAASEALDRAATDLSTRLATLSAPTAGASKRTQEACTAATHLIEWSARIRKQVFLAILSSFQASPLCVVVPLTPR